jgi:hypothetical protein
MEKTISPCPFTVIGEEEKKINPQNHKTWHEETLTLRAHLLKNLIKTIDRHFLLTLTICRRGGRGTSCGGGGGVAWGCASRVHSVLYPDRVGCTCTQTERCRVLALKSQTDHALRLHT